MRNFIVGVLFLPSMVLWFSLAILWIENTERFNRDGLFNMGIFVFCILLVLGMVSFAIYDKLAPQ